MPAVRSTRDEPEAEREAIERTPLLIHSLAQFGEATRRPLEIVEPRSIVEIGGEGGKFTAALLDWATEHNGTLTTIDTDPSAELRRLDGQSDAMRLVEQPSPDSLDEIEASDLYVIDGDHNYAVVNAEVDKVLAATTDQGRPTLLVFHDVCWPWARRDLYYSPESLAEMDVHPHSFTAGLTRESVEPQEGRGYRGNGTFAIAETSGGERNGVLTAIEDAISHRQGLDLYVVQAIFGLGFLFPTDAPWAGEMRSFLRPLVESDLIPTLEQNRLALYLQILDLQSALERRTIQYNSHLAILEGQVGRAPGDELRVAGFEEVP
ncbi:MAG TPA: class I SAM-dependent methyltransferase [Solirubrobacterales bacterium]|nr:class I SAM-dependent methyltransferase [Solirubrobacterales bacterium]